ncbi:MAG: four helix bundle protein [Clostridia bacterium]|nr:four helix bundle protein [Clostridia bacterium]
MENQEDKVLSQLNKEIDTELGVPPYQPTGEGKASRKPFRIHDFDSPRDKEMAVFTHAKKLSEYIFVITEKSPVKLRWSIVSRLLNCSVDIIENLYMANYTRGEERIVWQKKAMIALNLLDFYTETAKTKQAITVRQMTIIVNQITEVRKLLTGWVKSTKDKL